MYRASVILACVAALVLSTPRHASAQTNFISMMEFGQGDGYAVGWESAGPTPTCNGWISGPGNTLAVVGRFDRFSCPFADLNPNDPSKEYTFLLVGQSSGTTTNCSGPSCTYTTVYPAVAVWVYEGSPRNTPPDAYSVTPNPQSLADVSAFTDGTLLLASSSLNGSLTTRVTVTPSCDATPGTCVGTMWGSISFNSSTGTLYGRIASDPFMSISGSWTNHSVSGWCWYIPQAKFGRLRAPTVSVSPPCGPQGTVYSEPGQYFSPNSDVELRFFFPNEEPDPPNPIEHTDACGAFSHLYDSTPKTFYGEYSYYAVDLATGRQSSTVRFKILSPNRPDPPTGLTVENPGTGTTLKLSWNPSTSQFVERYNVYRWQTGSPVTWLESPTTTSFEDQGLTRGQEYYYAVSAADCVGEGLLSGAVPGTPEYYPVVLVHGICSSHSAWSTFAQVLRDEGFVVHDGLDLTENNDRPQKLVQDLADYLTGIQAPNINVVAHSMGGLVTREYIVKVFEDPETRETQRIRTLVTLGTPHHGSDGAGYLQKHPNRRKVLAKVNDEARCLFTAPALPDLVPGSLFLNGLNYGGATGSWDKEYKKGGRSWDQHQGEDLRDPSVKHYTIAGTLPMCGVVEQLIHDVWVEDDVYYYNDGIVSAAGARLWNSAATNWLDDQVGTESYNHSGGLDDIFCGRGLLESSELARVVANILRGQPVTPGPAQETQQVAAARTAQQQSEELSDLDSPADTLLVGQVDEHPFTIPSTPKLQVMLGSTDARLFLRSPTDSLVTPDDTLTTPGLRYVYDASMGLEGYIFENPPAGSWAIRIDGSTSLQEQEYATAIGIAIQKSIELRTSNQLVYSGEPVILQAWVDSTGVSIRNTSWNVTVMKPDSTTFNVQLYDDGAHGDSLASDGIFGASILPPGPVGFYEVEVQGIIPSDAITIVAGTAFELATFQDLAMDSTVSFSQGLISAGDSVLVFGSVRNLGAEPVSNVVVEFWDNETQFGTTTVNVAGNGTQAVQAPWIAILPDTHRIRITVSPFTVPVEASYTNNSTTREVVLGQPIVGVKDRQPQLRFWLGPAVPNPSRGTVSFRFTVPTRTQASFGIYDVAGRRIKHWHWEDLPAGAHSITWDGSDFNSSRTPTGVYFYRLIAGQQTLRSKMVVIR